MTSSNFKVNFVEPMVHIYQRKFRRSMFELYFICNFRDLPTHVRDVVESDIRDAVIKLCIGELDNQKRLEKAQSVIKIGKFISKYCQFLTQNGQFLGWNMIFSDKQPWHTKKRYYTAVGNEFMDSPKKKKTLNPKYMYILSLRLKEETFSNSQGDKAQPSRSSSSKSRFDNH